MQPNRDFRDLFAELNGAGAEYLLVGGYALAYHHAPRSTGDLDVWVEPSHANAPRVMQALRAFGAPMQELRENDFATPGVTYQIGLPPRRIDILTELTGLTFAEAWPDRVSRAFGDLEVDFIGRDAFIRNKRATGRTKDLADIQGL